MSYGASTMEGAYALVAEFDSPEAIMDAAEAARLAGYKKMDAYTPFPVHGLSEAIGFSDKKVPWTVFVCGLFGCFLGYSMEWYTSTIDYPLNVGGRPFNSLPAFIPVAYESTILCASFGAFLGMLLYNGLPRPYHSINNTPRFERCSQDRFFLAIETVDPKYDREGTWEFLEAQKPLQISEVEH